MKRNEISRPVELVINTVLFVAIDLWKGGTALIDKSIKKNFHHMQNFPLFF